MKSKIIFGALALLSPLMAKAVEIPNPLPEKSIPELIGATIKGILGVVGAVALLMLVWGGVLWMTSQGSSERVKKGKDTITWAIFGLLAIFCSYAVIQFIFQSLQRT